MASAEVVHRQSELSADAQRTKHSIVTEVARSFLERMSPIGWLAARPVSGFIGAKADIPKISGMGRLRTGALSGASGEKGRRRGGGFEQLELGRKQTVQTKHAPAHSRPTFAKSVPAVLSD